MVVGAFTLPGVGERKVRTRLRSGATASAPVTDSRFQVKGIRRIGVCPRGAQVRTLEGRCEKPLSSRWTSQAPRRRAPLFAAASAASASA